MLSNVYLYGEGVEVPEIPQEVIVRRLEVLNDNLRALLSEHYLSRNGKRIRAILKAKDFWEKINNG